MGYSSVILCSKSGKNVILNSCIGRRKGSYTHLNGEQILPVANKAWITLINVGNCFGIHVEANQNASQEVPCSWSQSTHHIHNS